jgi:hypothetical protein
MMTEFFGDLCKVCNDVMGSHPAIFPVWSDEIDNVICQHCFNKLERV